MNNKKSVLFIGSFLDSGKDGSVGGQMFASKTIINSELTRFIDWTLIDTTADSNVKVSLFNRIKKAAIRLINFIYKILFFKYDHILVFVAHGLSFWEKGAMCLLAKMFTKSNIIIAPRSGVIISDINKRGKLYKFIKYVFGKVDLVICQSGRWKTIFENISGVKHIHKFVVIENMIDFNIYKNIEIEKRPSDKVINILFLAWVSAEKGIFELINAVYKLKKNVKDFKLIVCGHGKDYDKVMSLVKELDLGGFVELRGWILGSEKIELLKTIDIFVLPTHFDGYPNSLMEAMASAKACIATRVGSIPDMITDNVSGLLMDKGSTEQLQEKLITLITSDDLRRRLGQNARLMVERTNAVPVGISKYKKIFGINI